MKPFTKTLFLSLALLSITAFAPLQAQRISAMLNFSDFHINDLSNAGTQIDYAGSSSVGLNLRVLPNKKWAIRGGVGLDNLTYTVDGDGINTSYQAQRQDLKGVIGLERHFKLPLVTVYPGIFVPVTVVGEDIVNDNLQNIQNGNVRAGFGVMLGANLRLLKIFRVGVEFDATYDNFRSGVWESVDQLSLVPFKGISHNTSFVVGVAF